MSDLLAALERPIDAVVTVDFETFWSHDFTLSKLTTAHYVWDTQFQVIGVGVKVNDGPTRWMEEPEFRAWAATVDWARTAVLAHNCVPGDTEVLTRRGWRPIRDVTAESEIMQWDSETAALSWVRPLSKTEATTTRLLRWDTNHHRGAYTPEHRMYYATPDVRRWRAKTAEEVAALSPNNVYIPTGGVFDSAAPIALTDDEARLMEAIRADGSWSVSTSGACHGAQFNLGAATDKPERLRGLASRLGLQVTERSSRPGVVNMRLLTSDLARRIFGLLGREKEYGAWVLDLPVSARRAVLDEARYWDGSQREAAHSYNWACANPRTVEAFQLLAHATGWTFSGAWRDNDRGFNAGNAGAQIYIATVCEKSRAKLVERATEETFETPQPVFCFTVPTGAFLVRSGDRVFVTGNCRFDGFILTQRYGVHAAMWLDTLSMARALHGSAEVGGSLAKLAHYYGLGEKGHEVLNTKGKRREAFTPEEFARFGDYCVNDVELTKRLFDAMLAKGFPEFELHLIDTTLRMYLEPAFILDEALLTEFRTFEQERKAELLTRVAQDKTVLASNDKFATLLMDMGVEPPTKISPKTGKTAWALAKSDPGMQGLLEHEDEEIRWLAEARIGVKSTINETRTERFLKLGEGGRPVPVALNYYGAHTGRWSGSEKTNFQNLERVGDRPRSGTLRRALLAPEGYELVVADSGQIEARVIGWLAGDQGLLDTFIRNDQLTQNYEAAFAARAGALGGDLTKEQEKKIAAELAAEGIVEGDFYSDAGSKFFGKKLSKKETPNERFIAKSMCLGLGFGMGWAKFSAGLLQGMLGSAPVKFTLAEAEKFGVDVYRFARDGKKAARVEEMPSRLPFQDRLVHCAVTKHFVDLYRSQNAPIVDLWNGMELALAAAEEGSEVAFGPGKCLSTVRHGIRLPNGLCLKYPGLKDDDGFSYLGGKGGKTWVKAYGGSVTENVVQALARIVVAEQMLRVKAAGYKIVTTTHDEIVALTEEGNGQAALNEMLAVMRTPPEWATGLPLNAAGGFGKSYGAVK